MLTLAIETSGRAGSIALMQSGELLAEIELTASGRRHARTLVPEIRQLLSQYQFSPQQVDLLAVSLGPGSFTGLRVGLVCAKTFAYATGCHLVGVDTFLAVAASMQSTVDHLWVIEDALRGDICAGEYRRDGEQWNCLTAPRLLPMQEWKQTVTAGTMVSGPGIEQWGDQLTDMQLAPAALQHPHAQWIARVGSELDAAGQQADPWRLEPFYMRRSAAEEKADADGATG